MLRNLARTALVRAGRTRLGQEAIHTAVLRTPAGPRFRDVREWPESLAAFEDLAFLFSSNQLNHGIASLQLDEAAYLYRLVRRLGAATIAEIGRFKGGSTMVIAAALDERAELFSYDVHRPAMSDLAGPDLDAELAAALRRYGVADRVHLIVGDSRTAEPPPRPCDLVFVDGDHRYDAARADWERWRELVRAGGHVLFHDAVDTGGYGNTFPGVVRVVDEIGRDEADRFERVAGAGSLAHFVRV